MCLCDLSMQTHVVEEVKYAPQIARPFHSVQVIIVVSCGSITAIEAGRRISKVEIEAISWAAVRLGLSEQPMPVTRCAPQ